MREYYKYNENYYIIDWVIEDELEIMEIMILKT